MSDPAAPDRDLSSFEQLVMMLATSAMHQLGKLANPQTGKAEPDLAGAGCTIDLLGMLQEKTRGNLDRQEAQMLGEALTTLRLNFVQATDAPAEAPVADTPRPIEPAAERVNPAGGGEKDAGDAPKFHKSYG